MSKALVFSNNSWITVNTPYDPAWLPGDISFYATMFVAAKQFFSESRAEILAEAAVNKRLYPGIMYDNVLEDDIKSITREQH